MYPFVVAATWTLPGALHTQLSLTLSPLWITKQYILSEEEADYTHEVC